MAETKPAIALELVRDFVACSHGDFDRVRELLDEEPNLVNACRDWGGGDWETGLGAAAHVGRRDIAMYLLHRGANRYFRRSDAGQARRRARGGRRRSRGR